MDKKDKRAAPDFDEASIPGSQFEREQMEIARARSQAKEDKQSFERSVAERPLDPKGPGLGSEATRLRQEVRELNREQQAQAELRQMQADRRAELDKQYGKDEDQSLDR